MTPGPVHLFAYCNGTGRNTIKPTKGIFKWFHTTPTEPYTIQCPVCQGAKNILTIRDNQGNEIQGILR